MMEASILVLPPPPIQGIGNAAGFTMQVELRDGSFDFAKLQAITDAMVATPGSRARCSACVAASAPTVPQFNVDIDRIKTQTLK